MITVRRTAACVMIFHREIFLDFFDYDLNVGNQLSLKDGRLKDLNRFSPALLHRTALRDGDTVTVQSEYQPLSKFLSDSWLMIIAYVRQYVCLSVLQCPTPLIYVIYSTCHVVLTRREIPITKHNTRHGTLNVTLRNLHAYIAALCADFIFVSSIELRLPWSNDKFCID